ncbi:MAG: ABC-2 family transporter protein [Actinomycetota bacterium]
MAGGLRLGLEIGRRSFRRASTYRAATAAGVFVNTVFGYLRASVLVLVAASAGGVVNGMTTVELTTYAFVTQGFIMVTGVFGDTELADRIRTGDIVIDLYRPADLQWWWLSTWLGRAAFQAMARGIPPVLLGALTFDVRWPDPWWHWLPFALSMVLASIVGFGLRFISNLSAFWLLDNRGTDQMVTFVVMFFGGLYLPIALFPGPLEAVARALPFASMIQLPAEVFLGRYDGAGLAWVLAQQALWAVALLLAGRALLGMATRRVVVQGG